MSSRRTAAAHRTPLCPPAQVLPAQYQLVRAVDLLEALALKPKPLVASTNPPIVSELNFRFVHGDRQSSPDDNNKP
jgi:hypothetical protein